MELENVLRRNFCFCNYICKWLDVQVFSDKDFEPQACIFSATWFAKDVEEPTHLSNRVGHVVPGVCLALSHGLMLLIELITMTLTRNTGIICVIYCPVWLGRLLPCSTKLVSLLSRGLCFEDLVMFIGMGGVKLVGRTVGILARCSVLSRCFFLGVKLVTGRMLESNMPIRAFHTGGVLITGSRLNPLDLRANRLQSSVSSDLRNWN